MSDKIRNWKVLYEKYEGPQKKALEIISKEMGTLINRDPEIYAYHVLPFIKDISESDGNLIMVGTYDGLKEIQKYVTRDEIPQHGYLVKVFNNLENEELKIVIITAFNDREVMYGAVDFTNDYFVEAANQMVRLTYSDKIFYKPLPDYVKASEPKFKTRSVFTWGHPINDYKTYIDNLVKLKINQLVIWNDYVPLNASEVYDYAHECGIELLWGYAWGWGTDCSTVDIKNLDVLGKQILNRFESDYAHIKGDGIYFQSFTELKDDNIDGVNIAEAVTKLVNDVAGKLLNKYPDLHIQFGLHAMSVKTNLEYLDKVDKRVEIVWEDCGTFPYNYLFVDDEENYEETNEFIAKILTHRPDAPVGAYFKGQLVMEWFGWEWGCFEHQKGRYILGMESKETIEKDAKTTHQLWKALQNGWLVHGKVAYDMANFLLKTIKGNMNLGMAGQLAGDQIWYSTALCAQLLWDPTEDYDKMCERLRSNPNIHMG